MAAPPNKSSPQETYARFVWHRKVNRSSNKIVWSESAKPVAVAIVHWWINVKCQPTSDSNRAYRLYASLFRIQFFPHLCRRCHSKSIFVNPKLDNKMNKTTSINGKTIKKKIRCAIKTYLRFLLSNCFGVHLNMLTPVFVLYGDVDAFLVWSSLAYSLESCRVQTRCYCCFVAVICIANHLQFAWCRAAKLSAVNIIFSPFRNWKTMRSSHPKCCEQHEQEAIWISYQEFDVKCLRVTCKRWFNPTHESNGVHMK